MGYGAALRQVPARTVPGSRPAPLAAAFTAASTQYADVASNASLVANGDLTVAFWLWVNALDASFHRLVMKGNATAAGTEWYVQLDPTAAAGSTPGVEFGISDGNFSVASKSATPVTAAAWHFVCATWANTAQNQFIALDNGAPDGGNVPRGPILTTTQPLVVASSAAHDLPLDGRIDALGFWKRVLTAPEQALLWNGGAGLSFSGVGGSLLTGLQSWWDFTNNWNDAQGANTLTPHNGATFTTGKT